MAANHLAWPSGPAPRPAVNDFPDHGTLMLVDIVLHGWAPFYGINLSDDVPGFMDALATPLSYPWKPARCESPGSGDGLSPGWR